MYYFRRKLNMYGTQTYNMLHKISGVCMILMLLWLTLSAPFVLAAKQELAKLAHKAFTLSAMAGCEEEPSNPYGNNTEEKAPSANSLAEEFLHDSDKADQFTSLILRSHLLENFDTYHAFHGEQLVPPPDAA